MLNICAISDLHGTLPEIKESDLLLIAGDLVPLYCQADYTESKLWLSTIFNVWAEDLPVDKVILIGGNHDGFICVHEEEFRSILSPKCVYLKDEMTMYKGITIYGTPWCHQFGNWWFMDSDLNLTKKFKAIPDNLDILLTHDAPYGCNDICLENVSWNKGDHIGSRPLREVILEKHPLKVVHGHLHSTKHEWEQLGTTMVTNVSILNEKYLYCYEPTYFELASVSLED